MLDGEKVRKIREERGLHQKTLADAIGRRQTHVSRIEQGAVKRYDYEMVSGIVKALDCSLKDLLSSEWDDLLGKRTQDEITLESIDMRLAKIETILEEEYNNDYPPEIRDLVDMLRPADTSQLREVKGYAQGVMRPQAQFQAE